MRETNRHLQMKLRDIEVANDDFERQARNTTSSLDDLESKYNVAIERGVLMEEEMKLGEQEREALRIETQRLRDELGDLKVEVEIKSDKLRHAELAAERQRLRKTSPIDPVVVRPRSMTSENSPTTTASSPTVATPPTKSASSTVSETPTPPSPPTSETSLSAMPHTPALPMAKSRLSITNAITTPRPTSHFTRPPRHSRRPSIPLSSIRATPSTRRTTMSRQEQNPDPPGMAVSGSLHQIRGLIGKMQKLEQRVNSARSKLPAPASTPPRASPRTGSALGQSYIPPTVTMRSSKKRTGGSDAASALCSTPDHRPSSRLSFGIPQPSPSRDLHSVSRPASRASVSSRTSTSQLPSAAASSSTRPGSRQSLSRAPTPSYLYGNNTYSDTRRPCSAVGGSYSAAHAGSGHGHSASISRLSNYHTPFRDETEESMDVQTPTPARRTTITTRGVDSVIPMPLRSATMKTDGAGVGRRTSSGPGGRSREDGDMGPPERKRLSGVGETF